MLFRSTYSGYNAKTPTTPGHIFEVFYAPNASTFINRDGHKINGYGDIPANRIIQTNRGTFYVATDYGVVVKEPNSEVWKMVLWPRARRGHRQTRSRESESAVARNHRRRQRRAR